MEEPHFRNLLCSLSGADGIFTCNLRPCLSKSALYQRSSSSKYTEFMKQTNADVFSRQLPLSKYNLKEFWCIA